MGDGCSAKSMICRSQSVYVVVLQKHRMLGREAEPQVSHWRQLLERAREESLVPDLEAVTRRLPTCTCLKAWQALDGGSHAPRSGPALHIFRWGSQQEQDRRSGWQWKMHESKR